MDDVKPIQLLMAGLPGAGKTTFLAALWHVVKSKEIAGSMQMERREGDQEYLNQIADQWSKCAELKRTPGEGEMEIAILLCDPENGGVLRLSIPDMSGELYASHWESRQCTESFADLLSDVKGCLLFINPGNLLATDWIEDVNAIYDDFLDNEDASVELSSEMPPTASAWEAKMSPTQVQLVEILQFFNELVGRSLRLAIIISAWDLVEPKYTPKKWVEEKLPLLWQYMIANAGQFSVEFTGVSAQGGKRTDTTLLEFSVASQRIKIDPHNGNEHDITHPMRWLMQ